MGTLNFMAIKAHLSVFNKRKYKNELPLEDLIQISTILNFNIPLIKHTNFTKQQFYRYTYIYT